MNSLSNEAAVIVCSPGQCVWCFYVNIKILSDTGFFVVSLSPLFYLARWRTKFLLQLGNKTLLFSVTHSPSQAIGGSLNGVIF